MSQDRIPTYEESLKMSSSSVDESLSSKIAAVQRQRIRQVLDSHITPLLHRQVSSGMSRMVYALVPNDSPALQGSTLASSDILEKGGDGATSSEQIVSFPTSDYVRVVRLHGTENNARFWKQANVVHELQGEMRTILGLEREPRPRSQDSDGWLDKKVGWQSNDFPALKPGEVGVRVTVEDLSIRRENQLGLYVTSSGAAVIIRVATA